jgi:hypothetical protein
VQTFGAIALLVLLALVVLGFKGHRIWRRQKRVYLEVQADRAVLSDEDFCRLASLDASLVSLVSIIRSKLASFGRYDPLRIYPEDSFSPHFGLEYDDDVAIVVQRMKIIEGYREYSFPLEQVKTVADFIKVVCRLKKEAEQDRANTFKKQI